MANVQRTTEEISRLVDCPKCGHSNKSDERYCDNCGASLVGAKASQPKVAAPSAKGGLFDRLFRKK